MDVSGGKAVVADPAADASIAGIQSLGNLLIGLAVRNHVRDDSPPVLHVVAFARFVVKQLDAEYDQIVSKCAYGQTESCGHVWYVVSAYLVHSTYFRLEFKDTL